MVHKQMSVMEWLLVTTMMMVAVRQGVALDNGLALTPPLGWQSGERFFCNTDCVNYPDDCISENLVKTTVKSMVMQGFQEAGFKYVALSDCWMEKSRDQNGNLKPDPTRFPSGMKALADFVHQNGFKLGLYVGAGNATCNGFPGSKDHLEGDAKMLASWGIDMVEMDGCNVNDPHSYDQIYSQFGGLLNQTGRPMLFVCDYPMYQLKKGIQPDFARVSQTCNVFKTHPAMLDSWDSLHDTLKYFGDNVHGLQNFSKPGSWLMPDNVLVGNYGLSENQQKMQMAVWSVMASPLFVSADLRHINKVSLDILLTGGALSINQDHLGALGLQIDVINSVKVWKRPTLPKGSFALAFLYENISGGPTRFSRRLTDFGLDTAAAYDFQDIYSGKHIGIYKPWHTLDLEVEPVGVRFIYAKALP